MAERRVQALALQPDSAGLGSSWRVTVYTGAVLAVKLSAPPTVTVPWEATSML